MRERPRVTQVTFRFRPPRPSPVVDLRGEVPHFYEYVPMQHVGGGVHEATVPLAVGTYQYKFFLSGDEWLADPHNPRTRSRRGIRNNVVVVGGTDEPILHAPAAPWLFAEDDGRVCVRAGLRRGNGDRLALRWDEGDGPRTASMTIVAREDDHDIHEGHVAASAKKLSYSFVLEDGRCVGAAGGAGQALEIARAGIAPRAPTWWRGAVIYTVFVDRFRPPAGSWPGGAGEKARHGGTLDGVVEGLDAIAELGANVVHLTPICLSPSAHRYDAIDPRVVDPALGGEVALRRLLDAAHARGMRVLLDMVVTHVHRDFFAFRDVRERGRRSPYFDWFHVDTHPFAEGPEPGYRHYQKGQWQEPLLRHASPAVSEYLAGTFEHWARFGVDGFRVDAAADVPMKTLEAVVASARAVRGDIAVFGEVVPENLAHYRALDAATDFQLQQGLYDLLWRRTIDARAFCEHREARRIDRAGPGWSAVAFTATHDQPRFASLVGDGRTARLAHLIVAFGAATPALYYGDELGLRSDEAARREFDDAWPDRSPMPWSADGSLEDRSGTRTVLARAFGLRRSHAALTEGDERCFVPESESGGEATGVVVMRRRHGDEIIDVVLNSTQQTRVVRLGADAPSGCSSLFVEGEATADVERGLLTLGPMSLAAVARVPKEEHLANWSVLRDRGGEIARVAFREGVVDAAPLPIRLYVTITEVCNIRCDHCITFAPQKTSSGTARTLAPWMIEALREPFAAAEYVAFVHGGESLAAPIFFDVLSARQRARARVPGVAHTHLLSNGMLLTAERVERLVDGGLTSLSVSLDGATEVTNDTLRKGGRLRTILENLEGAVGVRARRGADVRIGVSTVVTSANVEELSALGRRVRELGLDWLKVEEIFPCTPVARSEWVHPRDPRVERAMNELQRELAGSPVVLVDHRDPPRGCPCEAALDPALETFRGADDFANRTVFRPCRAEWEQACVDPDGTVHPVDYAAEPVGTLLDASLVDIWNSERMQNARSAALSRTKKSVRRACTR